MTLPSSASKSKVAELSLMSGSGPSVIVVSGPVVSTVKLRCAGEGSVLLAWSVAWTAKVCGPSESVPVVNGVVQEVNGAPSTEHSKVTLFSSASNSKVGVLSAVVEPSGGPWVIVVSGAPRSTSKVRLSGVWSVLPASSMARTSKVWEPTARVGVW